MEPSAARNIAEGHGCEEIFFSASDGVIVFEDSSNGPSTLHSIITIWYRDGIVSMTLPHPRRGSIQSFFFDVNNTTRLREVLVDASLPSSGHYVRSPTPVASPSRHLSTAIRQQLLSLEAEEQELVREREILLSRLHTVPTSSEASPHPVTLSPSRLTKMESYERQPTYPNRGADEAPQDRVSANPQKLSYEDSRPSLSVKQQSQSPRNPDLSIPQVRHQSSGDEPRPLDSPQPVPSRELFTAQKSHSLNAGRYSASGTTELRRRDSPSRFKGNRCLFCLANEMYHDEFGRAWSTKPVRSVGLGKGYVIVYEDGGVAWWDVPRELERKFRNTETRLAPVQFVALGPDRNYFIKFSTGKMEWVASDSFQSAIRRGVVDHQFNVQTVVLGARGSWVIVWSHGLVEFEGLPPDLGNLLKSENRSGSSELRDISLGPNDEWFVIFQDHSVQAYNLPESLHTALAKIKDEGGRLRSIVFGHDNSWYVRFWDAKHSSGST